MVRICFIGIMIGTFALALVSAVMHGFEYAIHQKMQGIQPQLIIRGFGQSLNHKAIANVIKKEFPEVAAYSPVAHHHAIIQTENSDPFIIALRGINPLYESQVNSLEKKIVADQNIPIALGDALATNKILIGKKLAEHIAAKLHEPIQLFYSEDIAPQSKRLHLQATEINIGGLFESGIEEYDTGIAYISLSLLKKIFPEIGISQINIKLQPNANEQQIITKLKKRLKLQVYSWKDLYPALLSAIKLEKYVMFFVLALITLVASMNIMSVLFMQIIQKRPDIAILKTMGASNKLITQIFMFMGMAITTIASLVGLSLACIASWLLQRYPFITLPDTYLVSHLPAKMEFSILLAVLLVVLILSFFATWLPTRQIKKINISQVLRFEG